MSHPDQFLTRDKVRAIDREAVERYKLPSAILMENAGRGVADRLVSLGIAGPVAIVCGKGNNGGDGMVLARHLVLRGNYVDVLLVADPAELGGDALLQWRVIQALGLRTHVFAKNPLHLDALDPFLDRSDWIVDALFGTGLRGPIGPPLDGVVARINASLARVLAIDLPSGLDADTGEPMGPTVRADHTVTFVAPKAGFRSQAASSWTGRVHVADIGISV